ALRRMTRTPRLYRSTRSFSAAASPARIRSASDAPSRAVADGGPMAATVYIASAAVPGFRKWDGCLPSHGRQCRSGGRKLMKPRKKKLPKPAPKTLTASQLKEVVGGRGPGPE